MDDAHELRRISRKILGSQERWDVFAVLVLVLVLLRNLCNRKGLLKVLIVWKDRHRRRHHGRTLRVVNLLGSRRQDLQLLTGRLRRDQTQILDTVLFRDLIVVESDAQCVCICLVRWGKTEGKCEWTLALCVGNVVLTPVSEHGFGFTTFQGCVAIEDIRRLDASVERLFPLVPQKEVHEEDNLLVGVVHRCCSEQDQYQTIGDLDQSFEVHGHRGLLRGDVVGLVNDQQAVVKVLMDPGRVNIRLRSRQLPLNGRSERIVGLKLVELVNDTARGLVQAGADFIVFPVLGLRFNTKQHIQVTTTGTLLGAQRITDLVQIHTAHVKDLCPEVLLHRARRNDQHLLVLKLGAQDVLFGDLNTCAGLSHSRSVDHQQVAGRRIGRQDPTK